MSIFTGPLTLTELDLDWRQWRLEQPLIYVVGAAPEGPAVVVPRGFITDGASVPRPLWWLLPAWGRYSRAAVVHDYLCAAIRSGAPQPLAPDRRTADALFYQAMAACGVNVAMRWLMWAAVRCEALFVRLWGE